MMENRTVTPVGGNKDIKVDTRVLTATSRDIKQMMAEGKFREDLYYRLNVITIELPPLRKRLDDIPLLVKRFMDRVNEMNGTKVDVCRDAPSVVEGACSSIPGQPGNVRELLNIVESMMVLSDKTQLEVDDLPTAVRNPTARPRHGRWQRRAICRARRLRRRARLEQAGGDVGQSRRVRRWWRPGQSAGDAGPGARHNDAGRAGKPRRIGDALARFNNNRTRDSGQLGISVRTLQRKARAPKNGGEAEPGTEAAAVEANCRRYAVTIEIPGQTGDPVLSSEAT